MSKIKTLAIYLPQFHEVKENNEWWGRGFTEWTAVKSNEPYFENHRQPRVPYGENYYDLMKKETFIHQAELIKKYGIYGFCFYHYYFKDNKKILEKPVEKLLEWQDIDISFCFNWASESWVRSWSKIYGNVWGEKYENKNIKSGKEILLQEYYGNEANWKEHFEYLLPFFKDRRYIKKDGKPVFIFYNANRITCLSKMIDYWNKLAIENGFDGMYIIGEHLQMPVENVDAALIQQPDDVLNYLNNEDRSFIKNGVRCYEYSDVVDRVCSVEKIAGFNKCYYMAQVGLDDTPRRGENGSCMVNDSPELFEKMMDGLYKKSINEQNEYIFINAWNEWGEGMYLEPDTDYEYGYLEALNRVVTKYQDVEVDDFCENQELNVDNEQLMQLFNDLQKHRYLFNIAMQFLNCVQEECSFKEYFNKNDVKSVAVYGIGIVGKSLIYQLEKEGVNISYVVDRIAGNIGEKHITYRPEDELPEADMLIITAYDYEAIKNKLSGDNSKHVKKIVSIDEMLGEINAQ